MKKYKISIIGGDGTGPEVVDETIKVLEHTKSKFNVEFDPKALAWPTIILPPINFSADVKSLDPESVTVPEVSVSKTV